MSQQNNMDIPVEEAEQGRLPGLDANNNPIMDSSNRWDAALLVKVPARNVDWRNGAQAIDTGGKRRAAYGQQCGMVVPDEHKCNRCKRGIGAFVSCVVNVVNSEPQAGGGCMNCVWTREGYRCSHRLGQRELPACVQEYIASTAQASAAQADENPISTQSVPQNEALYISPFQCPPWQFSLPELRQISQVLLTIQKQVDFDIQQTFDEMERQQHATQPH